MHQHIEIIYSSEDLEQFYFQYQMEPLSNGEPKVTWFPNAFYINVMNEGVRL